MRISFILGDSVSFPMDLGLNKRFEFQMVADFFEEQTVILTPEKIGETTIRFRSSNTQPEVQ